MEEHKIKSQLAELSPKEQKKFLKGLLKDAKTTKRVNDLRYVYNKSTFPITVIGGLATVTGILTMAVVAGTTNGFAEAPVWADKLISAAGLTSFAGLFGFISTVAENEDSDDRAEYAKALSDAAKRDINLIKSMQKNLETTGRAQAWDM